MIFPKQKKGSHVGVVISFLIFILFLVFLYTILQPSINLGRDKGIILDQIMINFVQEASKSDITLINLENTSKITSQQSCINLQGIIGDGENQIPESFVNSNSLLVRDENGDTYNYEISGGNLKIGEWPSGYLSNNGYFLKVLYSDSFDYSQGDTGTGCNPTSEYEVSFKREEKNQTYESGILNIISEYESNYGSLKNTLGIPSESEFWFNFTYSNGTSVWPDQRRVPSNINIASERDYIIYLDKNATKQIGFMDYLIW